MNREEMETMMEKIQRMLAASTSVPSGYLDPFTLTVNRPRPKPLAFEVDSIEYNDTGTVGTTIKYGWGLAVPMEPKTYPVKAPVRKMQVVRKAKWIA